MRTLPLALLLAAAPAAAEPAHDPPAGSANIGVDASVASCVADVIQHIEFPKPKTDGIVTVNYPFVFRPGDDAKRP